MVLQKTVDIRLASEYSVTNLERRYYMSRFAASTTCTSFGTARTWFADGLFVVCKNRGCREE